MLGATAGLVKPVKSRELSFRSLCDYNYKVHLSQHRVIRNKEQQTHWYVLTISIQSCYFIVLSLHYQN